MNEAEWLSSTDPAEMLKWLTHYDGDWRGLGRMPFPERQLSDRKLRLWAAACWRLILPHSESQERIAKEVENGRNKPDAFLKAMFDNSSRQRTKLAPTWAALLRCLVGNPFRTATLCGMARKPFHNQYAHVDANGGFWLEAECPACDRLRTPTVRQIAQAIYAERAWDRLPILADALEEAGCTDAAILGHLRDKVTCPKCLGCGSVPYRHNARNQLLTRDCGGCQTRGFVDAPGPHARGCWVVDSILGKE